MVKDTINKNRRKYGLAPISNFGEDAAKNSDNFLLYSRYLGHTDPVWDKRFRWNIGGYCFNDTFEYDEEAYQELMAFIKKRTDTGSLFTLGSCTSNDRERFLRYAGPYLQTEAIPAGGRFRLGKDRRDVAGE